jgi:hypothetical protein
LFRRAAATYLEAWPLPSFVWRCSPVREGGAQIPVVALYWDSGKLTVAGPVSPRASLPRRKLARRSCSYGEATMEYRDVKKALDAYFKIPAPKR